MSTLKVWGDDTFGQVSDAPDGTFTAIAGGSINGLALRRDGAPVLWGSGPIGPQPIPAALAAEEYRAVALGRDDAVLIRQNGTLAAFGKNAPVTTVPAGSYRAVAVAAVHAVAIANDGTLTAWGSDSFTSSDGVVTGLLNAPEGRTFKEVEASVLYSLALRENGTLYGWGGGAHGVNVLAGWSPTPEDPTIVHLPGENFKAIAAGNVHALAIQPGGTVTGWGDPDALEAPAHIRFKAVAAGWGFSIGLQTDGTLWGWGKPDRAPGAAQAWTFASVGWTRFGDSGHYCVPGERFQSIAAAAFHVMGITAGQ